MSENNINCYEFDDYRLDVTNFQLLENGEPISLTQKSFELLHFFVENRGRILKKEELLDSLWEGEYVEEANLTQHIYMLRKALKQQDRNKVFIETIPKNGYRFLADVREFCEESPHISTNGQYSNQPKMSDYSNQSFQRSYLNNRIDISDDYKQTLIANGDRLPIRKEFSNKSLAIICIISIILISIVSYVYYIQNVNNVIASKSKIIAVLPFKQIDGEKDEKLGIGVADVLIARLANLEEITVSPTTSILRFADEDNSDLSEVGRKLGVEYVIAGVIQRENGIVRVTTQLYDVEAKRQVWTQTIDEEYSDIFTLQDKISEKVAQKVSMGFEGSSSALPYKQYTKNIEAYQAYSMGLSYWTMHTSPGFENAIIQFKKATEKDPNFVLAYAYLSDSYGHTSHIAQLISADEARTKGEDAANKALSLDPDCAEALAALALIYANRNRQKEAFELMKKSIEIKPNDAHNRHRIAWMYANKGQIEKSVQEMKIAQKLDPQSVYINTFLGEILSLAGKPDEAIQAFNKALEIRPNSIEARWKIAKSLEQKMLFDLAEKDLEKIKTEVGDNNELLLSLSRVYAKNNKKAKAKEILNKVISTSYKDSLNCLIAQVYLALGEENKAIERLEKVIKAIGDNIYVIKYDPNLEPLRNNEKFIEMLRAKEDEQGW